MDADSLRRRQNAAAAVEGFTLDPPPAEPDLCESAELFFDWAHDLCEAAMEKENVVALNQALVLLVKQYFAWRDCLRHQHRSKQGRIKHVCVADVFDGAFRRLQKAELTLAPPPLAVEPAAPRVYMPREPKSPFDGLYVGTVGPDPEFDGE